MTSTSPRTSKPALFTPLGRNVLLISLISTLLLPVWESSNAFADPPPWAPAHGYRNKHHQDDDDYERAPRRVRVRPAYADSRYGVERGTCNRSSLGQVLGGATGAAVGSTIGKGNGKTAAIIGGAILGTIVGGNIGQSMDRVDQGCVGQILEYAPDNRQVSWTDPRAGTRYQVTPNRRYQNQQGQYCRQYLTNAIIDGRNQQVQGTACRQPDGAWQMINP